MNLALKELGSPKPLTRHPYSLLITRTGREFVTSRIRKQPHQDPIQKVGKMNLSLCDLQQVGS